MKWYIWAIVLFNFLNLFAVEMRTGKRLADELKNMQPADVQNFIDNLSQEEQKRIVLYVLRRYEQEILDNIFTNPLLWVDRERFFLQQKDVPFAFIELIRLSRSFVDQDVMAYWQMIDQKLNKHYSNTQSVSNFLNFATVENLNKYYNLLRKEMRRQGLSNFAEFIQNKSIFELLNAILVRNNASTIPESVIKNPYIVANFKDMLLMIEELNNRMD